MRKKIVFVILCASLLSGCRMQMVNRAVNRVENGTVTTETPFSSITASAAPLPTNTAVPTATATLFPTPDLSLIGLPSEPAGTLAFDFVRSMCSAEWFTRGGPLPCPGSDAQSDSGYVLRLGGEIQGLPSNLSLLLTFPPQTGFETISSRYPPFQVERGDRFRAVLACRAHTFCDVEFILDYFDSHGQNGVTHWPYIFTDEPLVIDYSLDGLAGKTVQFDLAVRAKWNSLEAYAVWIAPHIYRPTP
jgi:hypothetical protein